MHGSYTTDATPVSPVECPSIWNHADPCGFGGTGILPVITAIEFFQIRVKQGAVSFTGLPRMTFLRERCGSFHSPHPTRLATFLAD